MPVRVPFLKSTVLKICSKKCAAFDFKVQPSELKRKPLQYNVLLLCKAQEKRIYKGEGEGEVAVFINML